MTPEHTRDGGSRSGVTPGADGGARPDPSPTRRGVLLGVSLAGLGGALAGCSTAAVPYGANEAGAVPGGQGPGTQGQGAMATSGAMSSTGAMSNQGGAMQSSPAPAGSDRQGRRQSEAPTKAKVTGMVLGAASDIPVGGGKIYKAAKVVVTQPARGQYKAFSAVCTHVGCIMSEVANGTIDCPCHGGQFKITNGAVVAGPPPSPLPARPVKIVNGQVVLL
jgi:Rieske Fe-S protein